MHYIRIWYKLENRWSYATYHTADSSWRESFLILKAAGSTIKLQYLDTDTEADTGSAQKSDLALCLWRLLRVILNKLFSVTTSKLNDWLATIMPSNPSLFLYKNRNKQLVKNLMNTIDWPENDDTADLANQDKYSIEQLHAMRLVARMKEAAEKVGAGFVGGFVTPTGQRFMMSNVDENDIQFQAIRQELQDIQDTTSTTPAEGFNPVQNTVKIIESEDGIQLKIEPKAE